MSVLGGIWLVFSLFVAFVSRCVSWCVLIGFCGSDYSVALDFAVLH